MPAYPRSRSLYEAGVQTRLYRFPSRDSFCALHTLPSASPTTRPPAPTGVLRTPCPPEQTTNTGTRITTGPLSPRPRLRLPPSSCLGAEVSLRPPPGPPSTSKARCWSFVLRRQQPGFSGEQHFSILGPHHSSSWGPVLCAVGAQQQPCPLPARGQQRIVQS